MRKGFSARFFAMLLAAVCLAALFPVSAAAASGAGRVIRVGFFAFDGYHVQDAGGRRSGYGYDFLQDIARYGDWTYEYVGYDKGWSEMQDMLADGEIDLLTSARKTPEREARFAFSNEAIGSSSAILTVKSGDTRFTAGDYKSYGGMRVGLLRGNSRNDDLVSFAAEKGFSYVPVYFSSVSEMTDALQAGDGIDALLTSSLRSISGEWILDEFASADFYVMVRKDDTALLAEINSAISQLDANMSDWRHLLWAKYYTAGNGGEIAFTADEREYIRRLQTGGAPIRAVMEPDRAPYSYFENGEARGIIPEIFSRISDMTGLDFEIVETADRADYFQTVRADNGIDVRIDAYDDFYDAEEMGYKLTSAYLTASVSEITLKSLGGEPASIAVAKNADPTDYRAAALSSGLDIIEYDSVEECLDAVLSGKADSTYVLTYTAQDYINKKDLAGRLRSTLLPQYSVSYAIGVSNARDHRLLSILEKAVANLDGSDVQAIILSQTENLRGALSLREYLVTNPSALVIFCSIIAAFLIAAVILVLRQHSMRLIEKKNEELRAEALRADRASEAKSAFLSSVSHDMRTPLNGVISFTDFALKADTLEKKQEYLGKAQQSAAILMSLINDTLEVSRIESGKMAFQPDWINCKDLFDGIVLVTGNLAAKKNIAFDVNVGWSGSEYMYADKIKMQNLLMNLLTNAVKYTPEGGCVHLSSSLSPAAGGGSDLTIKVRDNGIGISPEFLPALFEPFSQEHDPRSGEAGGSGLGLYIVHRIVTFMNGTIDVKSEKGAGSEFTVRLPVRIEERERAETAKKSDDLDFSGRNILLCEDNRVNIEIARTILAQKGITVTCAENGKLGAETFAASAPGEFDAILMDIHMPVMGGYEATRAIRAMKRPDALSVPIIAITADAYEEDVKKCLAAGMNGHTSKPIEPEKLFGELSRLIKNK